MNPLHIKSQEHFVKFNKMVIQIQRHLLDNLKKHKETKKVDPNSEEFRFNEVVDYVAESTNMPEIKEVGIYFTTTKAIKSLNKIVKDGVKNELAKQKEMDKDLAMALETQANSYLSAHGFFSTITKEVYVVKDAHLQHKKKTDKTKDKTVTIDPKSLEKLSKDTWKKEYGYKPDRINHKDWLRIHNRATLAHELFHYYMDLKSNTSDVILQEEYAYSNMIGWYRKDGLKDPEIIKASLMWWGKTIAVSRDHSLQLKGRQKDLIKEATKEAEKLIENYDVMCQIRTEARKYYDERKQDLEDGIFLEL